MSQPNAFDVVASARDDRIPAAWFRYSAVTILVGLGIVAAVLGWRRAAGALIEPLSATNTVAFAVLLSATVFALRWLWGHGESPTRGRHDRILDRGASLLLIALAAAVSVRGTSPVAVALLWGIVGLEEAVAWLRRRRTAASPSELLPSGDGPSCERRTGNESREGAAGARAALPCDEITPPPETLLGESAEDTMVGDRMIQQFVRYRSTDGHDVFAGRLRVALPARSRATSVHIAFCPPFARVPAVAVDREDGPTARIQPVQVLPYGARLDLKLDHAAEEESIVVLRFSATSSDA